MAKRGIKRQLTVKQVSNFTKNMKRITLSGDDLESFAENMVGGYVKLIFSESENRPIMRTYTIAQQRSELNEIDIDFMLHGDHGVAALWANNAKVGDELIISGGGPKKTMDHSADWFLIAGDMTALPALTFNLNQLPDNAKGSAYVEILSEEDKHEIDKPENVDIHWVINPTPGSGETPLATAVINAQWLTGQPSTWVACEFKTMKKIRFYLKKERILEKQSVYASSYWKNGLSEDMHKLAKQQDNQEFDAL